MIDRSPVESHPATSVFDLDPRTFREWAVARDLPKYLGDQVIRWVYEKGELDPARMTDLSKVGRAALQEHLEFGEGRALADQCASDGTRKLLLGWPEPGRPGGLRILSEEPARQTECVMIPSDDRRTACISSQETENEGNRSSETGSTPAHEASGHRRGGTLDDLSAWRWGHSIAHVWHVC